MLEIIFSFQMKKAFWWETQTQNPQRERWAGLSGQIKSRHFCGIRNTRSKAWLDRANVYTYLTDGGLLSFMCVAPTDEWGGKDAAWTEDLVTRDKVQEIGKYVELWETSCSAPCVLGEWRPKWPHHPSGGLVVPPRALLVAAVWEPHVCGEQHVSVGLSRRSSACVERSLVAKPTRGPVD